VKKIVLIFILLVLIISCYKTDSDGFIVYKIKKDSHSSGTHFSLTTSKKIECLGILTESCLYDLKSENQLDINKLFGLSDSYNHSDDSARFGWRSLNNNIEILTYVRRNNNFYYESMGTVEPNEIAYYSIEVQDTQYRFQFNKKIINIERTSQYSGVRYRLYPYFGGNEVAPHDIIIKLK